MKNHSNRESNSRTLKLFSRNFLRKSQVLVLLFLLVVSACQNQQEQNTSEIQKTIIKADADSAMVAYMKENGIITLAVSQSQRKLANQNLNFVAQFLSQFLNDEQFVSVFIEESKKSLAKGGIPGILVEDFLIAYQAKTGKPLLNSNSHYKIENDQVSRFLDLVKGFSLDTDRMQLSIKPRLYMPVLDSRFFTSHEKPAGIFAGHFYENSEKMALYSLNENNVVFTKFMERKELSLSSNISIVGTYKQESQFFLTKEEKKEEIIRMMNTQCTCYLGGEACKPENGGTGATCRPWLGGNPWACGYAIEVPTCEGCSPQYECDPYCCALQ